MKYYEAYDKRYRQVHEYGVSWSSRTPTPVVEEMIRKYAPDEEILDLGCGEGRDILYLLHQGYKCCGVDVSEEAVRYCQAKMPEKADAFRILDVCRDTMDQSFGFIYSVAVLHMLIEDTDRRQFYQFIRRHLKKGGYALICTMGDGDTEFTTDPAKAYTDITRIHQESGQEMSVASTSCRMISRDTFRRELTENNFRIIEEGITASLPDFTSLMYAVVL